MAAAIGTVRLGCVVLVYDQPGQGERFMFRLERDSRHRLTGEPANNLDFPDYAIAFAPKPYLINAAIQDFFPIRGTRATYEEVKP